MVKKPEILFVTKPLVPPWVDSGKLLPWLLVRNLPDFRISVMVPKGARIDLPNVECEHVYGDASSFTVPGADKIRLFSRLLFRPMPPIAHFFFSPNGPTSKAARLIRRRRPDVKMVQTIMSLPLKPGVLEEGLFADRIVVWSRQAEGLVSAAIDARGLDSRVVCVSPGVEPVEPFSRDVRKFTRTGFGLPPDAKIVLYAGDLEFSTGASTTAEAIKILSDRMRLVFVFACRPKTPASRRVLSEIEAGLSSEVAAGRVRFMGQVQNFRDLLNCVDCQVLPVETTYAKTDIPMVVLEGMSAGVPAIVGTGTPMDELVEAGVARGVTPGDPSGLAAAIESVLGQGGDAAALGASGRRYVLARHSAVGMAHAHAAIYRELAGMN